MMIKIMYSHVSFNIKISSKKYIVNQFYHGTITECIVTNFDSYKITW